MSDAIEEFYITWSEFALSVESLNFCYHSFTKISVSFNEFLRATASEHLGSFEFDCAMLHDFCSWELTSFWENGRQ